MAQLVGLIVTEDDGFRKQIGRLLRSGAVPVSVTDDTSARSGLLKDGMPPDVVIVDIRGDAASAMAGIERLRAASPSAGVFAVATSAEPDLILQAMRAGANEFFVFPPAEDTFHGAIRRTAARRETTQGARPAATTLVFFGAKGGAGTTTLAVNCGVELARTAKRSTVIVDLKSGLGEVALFLGVKPRYSVLDAIDNLHRLDREFLRELVVKHKSGLEILAGSDHFDRPSATDATAHRGALPPADAAVRVSRDRRWQPDQLLHGGRAVRVRPDVPGRRTPTYRRSATRSACSSGSANSGPRGERVRFLLNRAAEPYPIPLKQIETALGHPIHHMFPSDYKTVSAALNSGVPLAMAGNSELATQFDLFTRRVIDPGAEPAPSAAPKRNILGLEKIASIW